MEHSNGHRDVEGISSPIGHVLLKFVALEDNDWVVFAFLSEPKVWVLNVNSATCCANVLAESVANEDHRSSIALDDKWSDILHCAHNERIVKLSV